MSRSPPVVKETIFLPALEPSNITSRVSAPGAAASLRVTRDNIVTRDTSPEASHHRGDHAGVQAVEEPRSVELDPD